MKNAIKFCLWLVAFTPLVIGKSLLVSTVTGKTIVFRGMLMIISVLFIVLFIRKNEFRDEIFLRINGFIRHPLFIAVSIFIFLNIVSFIFAADRYIAFWGELYRAEGLVSLLFYLNFFIFSLLIFDKKDWLWFFKFSLLSSFIVLGAELFQFVKGFTRPGSFLGNPAYLSGYLLFSILFATIVFIKSFVKDITEKSTEYFVRVVFKYFSLIVLILSFIGIFLTETRGTVFGLLLSFIFVLLYSIFNKKSKEIFIFRKLNIQKLSLIIFSLLFIFSTVFIVTKKSEIWQKIPGFSRVADMEISDTTLNTRLIISSLGISAINPVENGIKKFLIGWGPDNFYLASGKHFDTRQFDYELVWFDRAHNKFIDVMVMNGVLGLISYLIIFFLLFKYILSLKTDSIGEQGIGTYFLKLGLLFFLVSYIGHLYFFFDQISTSIFFFIFIGFVIYLDNMNVKTQNEIVYDEIFPKYFLILFFTLMIFLSFIFVRNDFIGYLQMKRYNKILLLNNGKSEISVDDMYSIFYPMTTAQSIIRNNFLISAINNKNIEKVPEVYFSLVEDYLEPDKLDLILLMSLGDNYTRNGLDNNDLESLVKGEEYYRKVLSISANRPDSNHNLAQNLFNQKRYEESFDYFEKSFDLNNNFFIYKQKQNEEYYDFFRKYFENKDKENIIKIENRLNSVKTLAN